MLGWAIVLFVAGMLLILAEFIVPGGVCGVLGGLLVIGSSVLGGMRFPEHVYWVIAIEFLGAVISIMVGMLLLSRTRAGKFMILGQSQQANAGWVASESDAGLIGKVGEVFTPLRPVGTVMVDNRRIMAVANGDFIEAGARVRVIEVHGNRIVVETDLGK